jgi:hypothetical protein
MFLAYVVIDAIDPALEAREIAFDCVRMSIAANVFIDRVVDRQVARKEVLLCRGTRGLSAAQAVGGPNRVTAQVRLLIIPSG